MNAGRRLGDDHLIAYSSACLCWTCADLGRLDEALAFGLQAASVADRIQTDHELIRFNLTGLGLLYFYSGDLRACWKTGEQLLEIGEAKGDFRTFSEGYLLMGTARMAAGDFVQAEALLTKAVKVSVDPIYSLNARFFLSYAYFSRGKTAIAAQTLENVIAATEQFGYEYVGTSASAFYGIVSASMGNLEKGVELIHKRIQRHRQRGKRNHELIFTQMLGKLYLTLVLQKGSLGFKGIVKNAGFLLRSLPAASRLAENHLQEAVEIGTRIGARLRLAHAHLDLGLLFTHKKRIFDARNHITRSIELFEGCGADMLLAEARQAMDAVSL
jgi:tetratricopeptide (TPR) repeat protein